MCGILKKPITKDVDPYERQELLHSIEGTSLILLIVINPLFLL